MKVAMTVWGNRISPVFDSAQTILLADIDGGTVVDEQREFLSRMVATRLARMVVERGIDVLICGAISEHPAQIIQQSGIRLLSFVSGSADEFLSAYAAGRSISSFMMPGCEDQRLRPANTSAAAQP
ncbi:MAG: NifB/NifX family molybdenum-iron cluster-binding protein, partial [Desulfofustis sp.]